MKNLFGFVNTLTNEWKEGILSNILEEIVSSDNNTMNYMIFDGPSDSTWIENLNTALDENKLVCLSNG